MPTREEKIAFLNSKQAGPEPQGSAVDRFAKSITSGSDIGENIPGGHALAEAGTSIGAGIAAATKYPFSDKGIGELYDESIAPSRAIREKERAADEGSPSASFLKSTLAGLPMGMMKGAGAAAPAATAAAEQVATKAPVVAEEIAAQAPAAASKGGWLSGSSTAGKAAAETAPKASKGWLSGSSTAGKQAGAEAEAMASAGEKTEKVKQHLMKKYGAKALEEGIEFLPYWIRRPLKAAIEISKAGAD